MFIRTAILFCAAQMIVPAQNVQTPRPPALGQLPPDQFQRLLSNGLSQMRDQSGIAARNGAMPNEHLCSIPLLEAKVPHPEDFTMRRMPFARAGAAGKSRPRDPMDAPAVAPACENW